MTVRVTIRVDSEAMAAITGSFSGFADDVADGADDPGPGFFAVSDRQRIQTFLRRQRIARIRSPQTGADDAPVRFAAQAVVDIDRLMGPVKLRRCRDGTIPGDIRCRS